MLQLFIGALIISISPILVKSIELSPTMIGVYRCLMAALFLTPVLFKIRYSGVSKQICFFILLTSALFALDIYSWHRAVVFAGAGIGTILANTQVFYLGILGYLLYRDRLGIRFVLGLLLGFAGVLLIAKLLEGESRSLDIQSQAFTKGVAWGIVTGIFYTGYIFFLRRTRELVTNINAIETLALVSLCTGLFLLIIAAFEGNVALPLDWKNWTYVLLLGGLVQVAGWYFVAAGLPRVEVGKAGLILLIQPTLAAILGAILLEERMTMNQIIGSILTIIGIALGVTGHKKTI